MSDASPCSVARDSVIRRVAVFALSAALACVVAGASVSAQDLDRTEREAVAGKEVERLLETLKEQQDARQSGQDAWAETMKELIELGPDAVPALSQALIETPTEERHMLRSMPFVLRGIGDPRAVPALIQTLPKCNGKDGSDMGYNTENAELLAFMRKHDDDLDDRDPKGYNWGRSISEVRTALNKLTGTEHGEIELVFMHGNSGTPRQQHLTEIVYLRCAERWADWWKEHWQDLTDDERYSTVVLPESSTSDALFELDRSAPLAIESRRSGSVCEPLLSGDGSIFYDIDTGRRGGVHERWNDPASRANEEIVGKWAASQGFDLMGSQIEVDGKAVFVLKLVSGEAWRIPLSNWENYTTQTAAGLIEQGTPVDGLLVVPADDGTEPDYRNTDLYFILTRHGTPAFIRQGVEVHDTNVIIGVPVMGDQDMNPVGFHEGRRFGLRILKEE